jgi:hypothetical protein
MKRSVAQKPCFRGIGLKLENQGIRTIAAQYEIDETRLNSEKSKPSFLLLDGLAPITIFVGANNSGKSRLMRELFINRDLPLFKLGASIQDEGFIDLMPKIMKWKRRIERVDEPDGAADYWLGVKMPGLEGWILDVEEVGRCFAKKIEREVYGAHRSARPELEKIHEEVKLLGLDREIREVRQVKRWYVPMLRGMIPPLSPKALKSMKIEGEDFFKRRIEYDYFSSLENSHVQQGVETPEIFSGLGLYSDLRRRLLGLTQEERNSVRRYEEFLSNSFFAGEDVTLVPVEGKNEKGSENDVVHIKVGSKKEFPIYELGDGMQSLIICTYPIVTEARRGSLFFLEEPDLGMHPSLQRNLLDVLKSFHREMDHQFFITTHSNHMLDVLADDELVSIFSFSEIKKEALGLGGSSSNQPETTEAAEVSVAKFRIRCTTHRDRQILAQLGVRPSATFLANSTIWVEGLSDCNYLRAYMEAFVHCLQMTAKRAMLPSWQMVAKCLKEYKEDRHYAFVEYSGNNLVHWSFDEDTPAPESFDQSSGCAGRPLNPSSLCAQALVVADGDTRNKAKGKRMEYFHRQLDDRLIILPGKEIENLIPEALVKKQVIDDHEGKKLDAQKQDGIDNIMYKFYARLEGRRGKGVQRNAQEAELLGIGKFLSELGFKCYVECQGTGTLKATHKMRWGSPEKGVPAKIRECLKNESQGEQKTDYLPDYLTQDILWLCVCLFCHIASCNHDHQALAKLMSLKEWIKSRQNQSNQPVEGSTGLADFPPWPIRDPGDRQCLFSMYLATTEDGLTS